MTEGASSYDRWRAPLRYCFAAALGLWGLRIAQSPFADMEDVGWLHQVHLPIHETGHLLFSPFGDVPQLLGGSLFQIVLPLIFAGAFGRRGDRFAAFACLWWTAHSCWDVSIYIGDARSRVLPLLGDDPDAHDWFNLLGIWDRLGEDRLWAARLRQVGTLLCLGAVTGMMLTARDRPATHVEPS